MDQNRTDRSLRDALGVEIERALAVHPAPELRARVHARIDRERETVGSWRRWWVAGFGTLVAVVVLFVLTHQSKHDVPMVHREPTIGAAGALPQGSNVRPAPAASGTPVRVFAARTARPLLHPSTPVSDDVLIPPGEADAIRLVMTAVQEGRIRLRETSAPDIQAALFVSTDEIAIGPIAIEPLSQLTLLEGERQ